MVFARRSAERVPIHLLATTLLSIRGTATCKKVATSLYCNFTQMHHELWRAYLTTVTKPTVNMTAAAAGSAADPFLSQKQLCMIVYLIL